MNQAVVADSRPTWRRIVAFPLVSLVIALLVLTVATFLAEAVIGLVIGLGGHLQHAPTKDDLVALLTGPYLIPSTVLEIVFSVIGYKLVIRHLGEWPRDDFRLAGAARDGAHGLLAGLLIFSLIVGLAALLGVYHITGGGTWGSFLTILFSMGIGPGFREELMVSRRPVPLRRGVRRKLVRAARDVGAVRARAHRQPERDLGLQPVHRGRSRAAARRRLHADPQPVDVHGLPRRLERHPGIHLGCPGLGLHGAWPGDCQT